MGKTYRNVSNTDLADAMREKRRSSAASPHRNKARYTRKSKHGGWDE